MIECVVEKEIKIPASVPIENIIFIKIISAIGGVKMYVQPANIYGPDNISTSRISIIYPSLYIPNVYNRVR